MPSKKKSLMMTALGMGVTYLMNNKEARTKVVNAAKAAAGALSNNTKSKAR